MNYAQRDASTPPHNDSDILSTANRLLFQRCPKGTPADLLVAADCVKEALQAHGRDVDSDVALRMAEGMVQYHAKADHPRWIAKQRRRANRRWSRHNERTCQRFTGLWLRGYREPKQIAQKMGVSLRTAQRYIERHKRILANATFAAATLLSSIALEGHRRHVEHAAEQAVSMVTHSIEAWEAEQPTGTSTVA